MHRTGPQPGIGERVRAFGYPSETGAASSLLSTSGVISGAGRTGVGIDPIEDYYQSDATLPSGFAGGPVVDRQGRLVGMSTALPLGRALILGPVGIGLSIPGSWIERSLDWIRAGQPPRPWLGIVAAVAEHDRKEMFDLPATVNTVVEAVFPGGPADQSGMWRGDGLLRIDGIDAGDVMVIHERLLTATTGRSWKIDIVRAGQERTINVTLAPQPERPRLSALDALRAYGGLDMSSRGKRVRVNRVLLNSMAALRGIKKGDELQSVLIKKDLERADKGRARWRTVRNLEKLEEYLDYAYSDLDFFVGLRLKQADGRTREIYLYELLIGSGAL